MEQIPNCGFGTYRLKGNEAKNSVLHALKCGYTHIDTANLYANETEVGEAIKENGVQRSDIWITTKVQIKDIRKGQDAIYESIRQSLEKLDTSYIDLVLLHGPVEGQLIESWKALENILMDKCEKIKKERIRFIGVSNYDVQHLETILDICEIKPYANQFEISPYLNRDELVKFCKLNDIIVVAHTSLIKGEKFKDPKLIKIHQEEKISKALLLLGWALTHGMVVLPRSKNPKHIEKNLNCINTKLCDSIIRVMNRFHEEDTYFTHPQYIKHIKK
jgi:diketogulonate reductase-like aldo/keto reductase